MQMCPDFANRMGKEQKVLFLTFSQIPDFIEKYKVLFKKCL